MPLAMQLAPVSSVPAVEYRWDPDTEILSARLATAASRVRERPGDPIARPRSGSIEVEGEDGSWLTLDLEDGRIRGVQVAVWPRVRSRAALRPPTDAAESMEAAVTLLEASAGRAAAVSLEVTTELRAESDDARRAFHFMVGRAPPMRRVHVAADVLLELDARQRLAGLWLLNVPPLPDPSLPSDS